MLKIEFDNRKNGSLSIRIMKHIYSLIYSIILFISIVLWLQARPGSFDIYDNFRAGLHTEIEEHYQSSLPQLKHDRFLLTRSILANKTLSKSSKHGSQVAQIPERILRIFRIYFSILDIKCKILRGRYALKACLGRIPLYSIRGHMEKLTLIRARKLAMRYGMKDLGYRFLYTADLSAGDYLTRKIYCLQLADSLENNDLRKANTLANSAKHLNSAEVLRWRGRVHYMSKNRKKALNSFLAGAKLTRTNSDLRSFYKELTRKYGSLRSIIRNGANHPLIRSLVIFSPVLKTRNMKNIKGRLTARYIIRTANHDTIKSDGIYFIKTEQFNALINLCKTSYTALSHRPQILLIWEKMLLRKKQYRIFNTIMEIFPHAKKGNRTLWRLYISFLERKGNKKDYFQEILSFLKKNQTDYSIYDRLITFLIGKRSSRRIWASPYYWQKAIKQLPAQPIKGRFVFWLQKYYISRGEKLKAGSINRKFYEIAPGSYYAHYYWGKNSKKNFSSDWKTVRTRADYLRWIARYGGMRKAIQYLSRRKFEKYLDPRAISIWKEIKNADYQIPRPIMDFYRIGEYSLAGIYYRDTYSNKISKLESLRLKEFIGRRTKNLYLSVYYLRQVLRAKGIPEDPFSVPAPLLKMLYPRPYLKLVRLYANSYGIDEKMVYALMRQESMFRELAISRSGARGLMQIMPRTGAWLAKKMNIGKFDLLDPEISIRMGSKFFSDLLQQNEYDFRLAAVAYNGGPGNLRKWKRKYFRGDFNQFLEFIPSRESRNYCRITYMNFHHYRITYLLYP